MKTQCKECKGDGEVTVLNYREMEFKPPPTITTKKKAEVIMQKVKPILKTLGKFGGILIMAGGLIYGLTMGVKAVTKNDEQIRLSNAYEANKGGIVLVEYDQTGVPIGCYVEAGETYITTNPHRSIGITNRHDAQHVTELAALMKYDETKQGECHRFNYSFDHK